jgi:hypothetical protein
MTRYLNFPLLQEPFDFGIDSINRQRYALNVVVEKTPSNSFLKELAAIIVNASVGVYIGNNRNIFLGSSSSIPVEDGPYISIIETGGVGGMKIQNQKAPAYQRPGAQITVTAKQPDVARSKAVAIYNAFANIVNTEVTALT